MKKLLIHSNNTSFSNTELFQLSEQFVFDVDFDKDVDFYINDILTEGNLKQKLENCDIVFIKVSLSKNYLEYLGLRLAYHIRLTKCLGQKANIPIVIIAEESFQYLGLTYPEPSILFTKGIYLIKESLDDYDRTLKWFNDRRIKPLDEFSSFVSSITINPPANYLSHHSIANEWSILRWAKVLGISTEREALKDVRSNIESLLYYKYLQAKYPIEAEPDKAAFKINGKGRILYIDDEWNKGWDEVLSNYFATSSSEIDFETLKYDFKDKSHQDILKECDKKIQSFKPDVVLLDLRLSYSDFTNSHNSSLLTGYKVLKAIKLINPGIQVIIFTASNKVWNLLELQANGADGFLLKESPELTTNSSYTYESLSSLSKQMTICLSNAYLKEIWKILEEIRKQFSANPLAQYYPNDLRCLRGIQYQNLLLLELDSMYNILSSQDENRFSYAMLIQFKILECIVEIFIPEKARDGNWLFYDGSKVKYFYTEDNNIHERNESLLFFDRNIGRRVSMKIPAYEYNSTRNKIDCLVEQKLMVENKVQVHKKLKSLVNYRNGFIHPTDRLNLTPLNRENIVEWITIIWQVLKKI
jgi:CheY-like chemotaxis protein